MFYAVTARPIESPMAEFRRKLPDGTIAQQKPDGPEIVESMQRGRLTPSGEVHT